MHYSNLVGEMAKRRITNEAIANLLGIHRNSVYNKIRGMGTFSVDEAITIRNNFFPDMKIEELFPPEQKGA